MKLYSWNINGIRAAGEKGLLEWLYQTAPDILCLQETRAQPHQVDFALRHPHGYHTYWAAGEKNGYAGVALYSVEKPLSVQVGLGEARFDAEGRTLIAEYPAFTLINTYIPSGTNSRSKWFYKMAFLYHLLDMCAALRLEDKPVLVCGDFNIAHQEIDLVRPIRVAGFLPEERDWISELLDLGFVDAYRFLHPEQAGAYTWWPRRAESRERNAGWRLDYIFASRDIPIAAAALHPEVTLSDHCPVSVAL